MDWLQILHIVVSVGVTLIVFVTLQLRRNTPTDVLFLGALMVVTVTGVISPQTALEGFSNSAVLTIAGLLVVSAGFRATGLLDRIGNVLLGSARTERQALRRLVPIAAAASALILNTAVVAMMMPVVLDWCRRQRVSPSRLLIPLSFVVILGGVCTLIGTSTTLVVNGELRRQQAATSSAESEQAEAQVLSANVGAAPLGLFEIGRVGVPCCLAGLAYMLLVAPRLLPDRRDIVEQIGDQRREYLVEMLVMSECALVGKTVEAAGLRQLPGLFLIEIERNGEVITPVTPEDHLRADDRLVFTGVVNTIVDLEKIPGLVPAADTDYVHQPDRRIHRRWTEVVLSQTSPLIGRSVRDAGFRKRYNAAVIAVHRNGVRLTNKIGDIVFEAGDTLLLQTRSEFVSAFRNSREFYLVSDVQGAEPRRHHKTRTAGTLGVLLLVWLVVGSWARAHGIDASWTSTAVAAITIGAMMVTCKCLRASDARSSLDLQMLLTIAAALGLGRALQESGAASWAATGLVDLVGNQPMLLLIVLYALTVVLTEMLSNTAVAAMLLPLALATALASGYDARPFVIAITVAASLSFVTPIGYQTNLMVLGPGGYRPRDFLRVGLPLAVLVGVTALLIIPRVWPF